MPYVTSIERLSRCDGIRLSMESVLQERFGKAGTDLMPEIRAIYDEAQLLAILKGLLTAANIDEARRLCSQAR